MMILFVLQTDGLYSNNSKDKGFPVTLRRKTE